MQACSRIRSEQESLEKKLPHKLSITVEKLKHVLYVQAKCGICFSTAKVLLICLKLRICIR